jgi:hypothetical protein
MEAAEAEFLDALISLSTAKDKIFEISNIMLAHQSNFSKQMVSLWFKEFSSLKEEKKTCDVVRNERFFNQKHS